MTGQTFHLLLRLPTCDVDIVRPRLHGGLHDRRAHEGIGPGHRNHHLGLRHHPTQRLGIVQARN